MSQDKNPIFRLHPVPFCLALVYQLTTDTFKDSLKQSSPEDNGGIEMR